MSEIVARCHGVEVPASPYLGPGMVRSIDSGRYEAGEIAAGLACIPKASRILELGAGAGIVGAVLARNCEPVGMVSIEANPRLIPHIRDLHAHNGLDRLIDLRHCVVLSDPDAPQTVDFHVLGNFLGSSLAKRKEGRGVTVNVPVLRYADLTASFPHDAIMMDIEGGELDFLRHADLGPVKVFVAEFHEDVYGKDGMEECGRLLSQQGLVRDEQNSRGAVQAWVRK